MNQPTSAKSRALATSELLTLILAHVDMRSLLHAQRVSHTWYAVISTAPTLQRRLFFHPAAAPPEPCLTGLTAAVELLTYPPETGWPARHVRRVRPNPLLRRAFPTFFPGRGCGEGPAQECNRAGFVRLDWAERPSAFAHPTASWRRMLLADPAPQAARLEWRTSSQRGEDVRRVDLLHGTGGQQGQQQLVMGRLWDLVQELVVEQGRFANATFEVDWHLAEANTEEEWLREEAEWLFGLVPVEGDEFVLTATVRYSYGCITSVGPSMPSFRSEAEDVVDFEAYGESNARMY